MIYEKFKEKIKEDILKYLPGCTANIIENHAINESRDLLYFCKEKKSAGPSLCLNHYYDYYINNDSNMDKVIELMVRVVNKAFAELTMLDLPDIPPLNIGGISVRIVNTELNEKMLENCPNRQFLDLSIVYVMEYKKESYSGTLLITNTLLEQYGMTEEELYQIAYENTSNLYPFVVYNLIPDDMVTDAENMFLVTNKDKQYGASAILYSDLLDEVAEKIGSDLYVIPSSVHELLILSIRNSEPAYLIDTISDINANMLEKKDFLSNNLYYYCRKTKKVSYAVKEV